MNILFVTWDGPQVSYLESLFLPIFRKLAETGTRFHILQFTWGDAQRIESCRQACTAAGFSYQAEIVWRSPVAAGSLLTAINGARIIRKAIGTHGIDAVMPRSTLPAMATLLALRGTSLPMIFDADGLPLDERVDFAGQSPSSLIYRLLRDIEAQAARRADVVLTRSYKAVDILLARAGAGTPTGKFHVVSNGRDVSLFSPGSESSRLKVRQRLNIAESIPMLIYSGSIGPQYCLEEMLGLFDLIHQQRPDARLLVLTGSPELLPPALEKLPALAASVSVMSVPSHAVPEYLACADLGLALRRSSFSMQGVAPIKLGEYLLCGLPVIATDGIGDTTAIDDNAGLLLDSMGKDDLQHAANWFIESVLTQRENFRSQCRSVGEKHFSLEASTNSYATALASLTP